MKHFRINVTNLKTIKRLKESLSYKRVITILFLIKKKVIIDLITLNKTSYIKIIHIII